MPIDPQTIVVQEPEPIVATVDDEIVMLSIRAGSYFGLGTVGSEIWKMIERPRSVADICAELGEGFDVDPQKCLQEVRTFLGEMLERGLVRIVDERDALTP